MTIRSGLAGQVGVGIESTWGTPVAATRFLPILSESMTADKGRLDSESIYANRFTLDSEQWDEGAIEAGGDLKLELFTTGIGVLLEHAIGLTSTSGAGPYVHTFNPADLDSLGLTVEVGKPGRGGTVHPWAFSGSKVASWEIGVEAGGSGTLDLSFSSETVGTGGALATWAPPAALKRFLWSHATVQTVHGASPKIKSIKFTGENGLETDRLFLGSQTIEEQDQDGLTGITGEVEVEFTDETLWDIFWAGTEADIALTLTRGADILAITANTRLDGSAPVLESRGKLSQTIPFMCIGDGSDADAFAAVLTNTDATP